MTNLETVKRFANLHYTRKVWKLLEATEEETNQGLVFTTVHQSSKNMVVVIALWGMDETPFFIGCERISQ